MDQEKKAGAVPEAQDDVAQPEGAQEEQPKKAPQQEEADACEEEPTQAEWRAALETAVKQRDEYLQIAQRAQADFQNFKRRNAQTRTEAYDEGVRDALSALLTTIDNLERALDAAQKQGEDGALKEGVEMTLKQMRFEAGKLGLEEVPALGEKFDPELHNAVMRSEEGEPGTVLEVFQKGYRVKGRMIRYAMVKVAVE